MDQNFTFSTEILCEIIGHLHDKKTLLAMGLVSRQTLYESRPHLFSTVDFSGPPDGSPVWKDFHEFLRLVDVAWTSFTPTIQSISLQYLNNRPADDNDSTRGDIPLARILTNLHNVKSLRLSNVKWSHVPSYILDLILQLPIQQLSLFWCDASNIPRFLTKLTPSLKALNITGMSFAKISDLSEDPSISHRSFRVSSSLDNRSLFLFKSVWDPSICRDLDIKVKTFPLCPSCNQSHGSGKMINVVQKFLSALPSPKLFEEISIAVKLVTPSLEEDLIMLDLFKWSSLVETIQQLFPSLKKLTIRIGTRRPSQDSYSYFNFLRRLVNVQQLEKEGIIELCAI